MKQSAPRGQLSQLWTEQVKKRTVIEGSGLDGGGNVRLPKVGDGWMPMGLNSSGRIQIAARMGVPLHEIHSIRSSNGERQEYTLY